MVQEVFLALSNHRQRLRTSHAPINDVEAYITTVAANVARDKLKTSLLYDRRRVTGEDALHVLHDQLYTDGGAQEWHVFVAMLRERLTPKYAQLFDLYYIQGFTAAEIATLLKLRVKGVESFISRLNQILRRIVGKV